MRWNQIQSGTVQSITRCQFQLSRRDRECLPFSLMLRDEIENFFPLVSCFETRSRISSLRSHASRRDREFLSSFSCFETRPRRMLKKMHFDSSMKSCLRMISISKTSGLVKIVFLNFCFHFCQNVTSQQDTVWGGWKWKWLLKVRSKLWFCLPRFPAKAFKHVHTDILKPSNTHLTIKI